MMKKMRRNPISRPAFFKVMIKDFSRRMLLPPAFVQEHGESLAGVAELKTTSGETWIMEIEKIGEVEIYLNRGWKEFVENVGVKLGEILVFWFTTRSSTFDVSVFGTSGSERSISARNSMAGGSEPGACTVEYGGGKGDETREDDHRSENARPSFELLLKRRSRWRLHLRKEFVEQAGLASKKAVVLKYENRHRSFRAHLEKEKGRWSFDITRGWSEFMKHSGLSIDKSYSFEYDSVEKVIRVRECRKGKGKGKGSSGS